MAALRKFGIILIFANLALARIAFSQWPQPGKCVRVSNDGSTLETSSYDCGAGGGGGIASLNALIDPAQTFATGTSGDDFNISSVSPIHAFNFPSASATKRGLLSFTDWGIFNGKESVLTFNSPLSRSVNTITCPTCSVSGHAHAEADVTNLVADLAAKVPTSRRIDTTTPLQGGDNLTADRTFSILQAGSAQSGYLSSTDWSLFNAKESSLTFSSPLSRSVNTITCPTCSISGHAHVEGDVTNLVTDLAAKEATANKNVASGYAGLDVNVRVPTARLGSGTPSASTFLRGDQTWAVPGSGSESENIVRTTSDVTNSTTTFADVTGLSFSAAASADYIFEAWLIFQSNTAATGIKFAVNGPPSPVAVVMNAHIPIGLTLYASDSMMASRTYDTGTPSASVDTINANLLAQVFGIFRNGTNTGNFAIRFAAETTGIVTIKAGSVLRWRQVN